MRKLAFLACLIATTFASGAAAKETTSKTGAVVSITLPGDLAFDYKKGPDADLVASSCLTCHSSAYVSTQPRLDKDHWVAEVTKMRKAYGAQITDGDAEKIATYLTAEYGSPAK